MKEQTPIIYALLIGIDVYDSNQLYSNLEGAVRDINLVETFLRESLKVPPERIRRLTSPHREDIAFPKAESTENRKPTYENIVNAFKEIT